MVRSIYVLFAVFLNVYCAFSQTEIIAKIVNSKTGESVPFAAIQYKKDKGVIANGEGIFKIETLKPINDSIKITSMGYKEKVVHSKTIDSILQLIPKTLELSPVYILKEDLSVEEILERVEDRLEENYFHPYYKKRYFSRSSYVQNFKRKNVKFKKSTIAELNKKLVDSIAETLPNRIYYFTEMLGDIYGNYKKDFKLDVKKSLLLEESTQKVTFESIQENLQSILKRNLKPNSTLKVKSGFVPLSAKMPLDSIIMDQKSRDERFEKYAKTHAFGHKKANLQNILKNLFFYKNSDINIVNDSGKYEFSLKGYQEFVDNVVYVLEFKPERNADFKGEIYIDTEDFAVLRLDYQSFNSVYNKKFNMFGIHFNQLKLDGKMFFSKGDDGFYQLKYANQVITESIAVDRPLKFIEINKFVKGRNKQNELSLNLDIEIINQTKHELVVYEKTKITENNFEILKEKKAISISKLSAYDPDFWKGYTVLAPDQLIKEFSNTKE